MSRWPRTRRWTGVLAAAVISVTVMTVLAVGYGPIPALGSVLDPGRGVWTSAAYGTVPGSERLNLPGVERPVAVSFTAHGIPSIQAADDHDLYLAQGYVTASFRLTEMDLERRLGEGRLAQLVGPSDVASDEFELRLGLLRTAEAEWAQTPRSSPAGQELIAYSRGVNDYLAHLRATGTWPTMYSLAGVYPTSWTPVDSLVIQGVLTQELSFTTQPLDYALWEQSLGAAKTMAWFPVDAVNAQDPYDRGPYRYAGITPIAADAASSAATKTVVGSGQASPSAAAAGAGNVSSAEAAAASSLLSDVSRLPAGQVHEYSDSNAWAVNGRLAGDSKSMLAGDPHLPQTLPSVWYEAALTAPGLAVSGASLPGVPGIVIGHNAHIAWSLTDVQNQSTLFYEEQTSKSHPGEYFWRGHWQPMTQVRSTIAVRGGAPVHLTVDITVHGPIMTQAAQTVAVSWMGNVPSPDVAVLSAIDRASTYGQFRAALADWKAPTQNFVYADDSGNIGAIAAGYYPQVAHGQPWLPLSGTGADDVVGVIPYAAVPQVYDPPGHVVTSANQRPVGASYPYYIGTSVNGFDPGYRAATIDTYLSGQDAMTAGSFAALQGSLTDGLAKQIVPRLLTALRSDRGLTRTEQAALSQLERWNDDMTPGSAGAAIWSTFWDEYLSAVFQPWWDAAKVPLSKDRDGLQVNPLQANMDEDLQEWTVSDPDNPAFTAPGGAARTSAEVMRSAFGSTVATLSAQLGGSPMSWAWGRLHKDQILSLTGAGALDYGPWPAGGDIFTVDSANGYPISSSGPSWRMIVTWTAPESASAEAIYPGGQSDSPTSAWYADLIPDWRDGRYLTMPTVSGSASGPISWSILPGGTK